MTRVVFVCGTIALLLVLTLDSIDCARITREELLNQIVNNSSLFEDDELSSDDDNSTVNSKRRLNFLRHYPGDFMQFSSLWSLVLHITIFVYLCTGLAVLIDSYFLPSLRCIGDIFHLPATISGPTLMALGTSSPEFCTNVISVFFGENAIGTGAVVGSAIVNTIAIPGVCGLALLVLVPGLEIKSKNRYAILRDLMFYAFTVITLIIAIKDNSVDWLESLVFIMLYALYIFTIYCWSFFKPVRRWRKRSARLYSTETANSDLSDPQDNIDLNLVRLEDIPALRILLSPLILLMRITIPQPKTTLLAILTFLNACLWITGLTYLNLWMVSLISKYLQLPDSIAGMTILALGTNIPELITNILLVLKYRLSDMAFCHVLGSNIFDILICLGLPWFFKIFILTVRDGYAITQLMAYLIPLEDVNFLYYDMTVLVLSWIIIYLTLIFSDWKITVKSGVFLVGTYIVFLGTTFFVAK